jgi:hypothetical protein
MSKPKKEATPAGPVEAKTVEEVMATLAANAGGKIGARIKNRTYDIKIGSLDNNFAPQCRQVLSVLLGLAIDDKGEIRPSTLVKEAKILEVMEAHAEEFTTVQGPWKLFQYYRKQLVDAGWLKEVADVEPDAEATEESK